MERRDWGSASRLVALLGVGQNRPSPMIAFATLFLGLVLGHQTVEMVVGEPVARVVVELDGRQVAALAAPPWKAAVDLGAELEPHELVAVAFDGAGREAGRARQWINLPRPPAEVEIVLEGGGEKADARVARLVWQSVGGAEPEAVRVSVDGSPIPIPDSHRIPLPPLDPERLHFLSADLDFPDNLTATAEITFGGVYADRVVSELTAVPVRLTSRRELPAPAALAGWFVRGAEPLPVAAVEEGPAEVVVVVDTGAYRELDDLARQGVRRGVPSLSADGSVHYDGMILHFAMRLGEGERVRFLLPYSQVREHAGQRFELFPPTADFGPEEGGMFWFLTRLRPQITGGGPQRLADAVAVAGMSAAGRNRRRAVVLILGRAPEDGSQLDPLLARHYLERLGVPLVVWTVAGRRGRKSPDWGEAVDVSTLSRLERAVGDLVRDLSRQRIVWVEGTWLPTSIRLSERASGVERLE